MEETNGDGDKRPGEIYGLMTKILAEVEAIGKGRRNAEQNYAFRGIDDVYNMIHPLFAKHGVFMLPRVLSEESAERPTRSGFDFKVLFCRFGFYPGDLCARNSGDSATVFVRQPSLADAFTLTYVIDFMGIKSDVNTGA